MSQARTTELTQHVFDPLHLLSSEAKPTVGIGRGQTIFEYDTGKVFIYTGSNWILKSNPDYLSSVTTIDLNQAAASYDLFTAGASSVQILEFGIVIPADLTGAAAGALTAISVQTTDGSPVVLISSATGAKANLTSDKHLLYTSSGVMAGTKKIQLTIIGGATSAAQACNTWLKYQVVS